MKVLQVSTFEQAGGAAIAAVRLHHGLRARGHASTLLVRERTAGDPVADVLVLDPDRAPRVGSRALERALYLAFTDGRRAGVDRLFTTDTPTRDLRHLAAARDADVVHLHWTADMLSTASIGLLQRRGVPVVVTLHDQQLFTGGCHYSGGCDGYARTCASCPWLDPSVAHVPEVVLKRKQASLRPADLTVVSPSRWLADCARASALLAGARVEVIPNGVPVADYQAASRDEARRRLALPADALVVLTGASRLDESRKGHAVWMQAVSALMADEDLRARVAARRLIFAAFGEGPHVEGALPVTRLGLLTGDAQVALAYRAADLFVLPTLEDNLPNTLLESVAAGTPVVAFRTGGVPDVIDAYHCGVTVPVADTAALAGAVSEVLRDDARRLRLARACIEAAPALDLLTCADAHLRLYDSLTYERSREQDTGEVVEAGAFARQVADGDAGALADVFAAAGATMLVERLAAEVDEHQRLIAERGGEILALQARVAQLSAALAESEARPAAVVPSPTAPSDVAPLASAAPPAASTPQRTALDAASGTLEWMLTSRVTRARPPDAWLQGPGVAGLISVVVPVFNAERFLREAIESVWAQSWPADRIELLVADDGSTDGSVGLITALSRDSPVAMNVLRHPGHVNRGVSATRNLALSQARGQYIALLDADDAWYPSRLAEGAALLGRVAACDAVCSLGDNVDDQGRLVIGANGTTTAGEYRTVAPDHLPPFTFAQLWEVYPVANSSLLFRREALRRAGPYPIDMAHQAEDWLLALKIAARAPIHCLDQHLVRYRAHDASYTAQYHRLALERGARLEVLYHIVDWLIAQPELREDGERLFRRHYPALLAQTSAAHAAVERVLADAAGEPGLELQAAATRLARERAELEALRRVVPAALRAARRGDAT